MNLELLQNTFRQGFYANTEKFANIPKFAYREDNLSKLTKGLVFQKEISGNEVDLRFHLNKIDFNSKLNAKIIKI
jgi:hypothetical protein